MNVYALNTEVITRKRKGVSNSSLRTGFYLAYIRPDALAFHSAKHWQGTYTVKPVHKPGKGMHLHFLHTCICSSVGSSPRPRVATSANGALLCS